MCFFIFHTPRFVLFIPEMIQKFHEFCHRVHKWFPVQRSDIVDNRHIARGEFNITFISSLRSCMHCPFSIVLKIVDPLGLPYELK